jgi:uncharacterized protein (TIGR00297 family)
MMRRALVGLGVSTGISVAGWRASALTTRGAAVATGVGAAIIGGASWPGAVLLGGFFGTSSALSRLERSHGVASKGSTRDEWQVLANGGVAAIMVLLSGPLGATRSHAGMAGALAAATADTWATAFGSTSPTHPRMLISGKRAFPGVSGAVTHRGMLAALTGSGLIAALYGLSFRDDDHRGGNAGRVLLAGMMGTLVDSVLGEVVQERRYCPTCDRRTEARVHRCGTPTLHVGGIAGVTNDLVNLACTLGGALVTVSTTATISTR